MSADAEAAPPVIVNSATAFRGHAAPLPGRDWLMLGLLSFLWGGSFFFYKLLAPVLPPFTLVLGRVLIAALALHLVLLLRGQALHLTPK
ncbi:MAG: EamA family transporter, partial [Janthinobacterium lividum]